ncbi:cation diffusion facilitator family transporter [Hazenella coriacea]|uniref:Cation diffusion facilitator family transporter n=1 Tax=Hazenella coriacea TaxID=1179467 RepID=A0A4R3L9R6_9BACL|nr:cation diffusion facilitator family transporter [Hazenella coriacea]TCS96563.1 cation diffusion facilitator family transporter [Hazenella coriacea]
MEQQNLKSGEKGAWISILAYICLSILKVIVSSIAHSEALFADGLNNSTDILASLAVLIGLRLSRKPPDEDHPYGHRRAETISSLIASFIMMTVGLQVLLEAVKSLLQYHPETPDVVAAYTSFFSALVMYGVYRYNKRLAQKVGSKALDAAAKDNLSDAWVSIGVTIGILGTQWQLPWLDPVTALIVGFMICKTAWDIFWEATHTLTDGVDEEVLFKLKKMIEQVDGVHSVNDIKARLHGNSLLVDVAISVSPKLNVVESHTITELVEDTTKKVFNISHIHVHVEPIHIE